MKRLGCYKSFCSSSFFCGQTYFFFSQNYDRKMKEYNSKEWCTSFKCMNFILIQNIIQLTSACLSTFISCLVAAALTLAFSLSLTTHSFGCNPHPLPGLLPPPHSAWPGPTHPSSCSWNVTDPAWASLAILFSAMQHCPFLSLPFLSPLEHCNDSTWYQWPHQCYSLSIRSPCASQPTSSKNLLDE